MSAAINTSSEVYVVEVSILKLSKFTDFAMCHIVICSLHSRYSVSYRYFVTNRLSPIC